MGSVDIAVGLQNQQKRYSNQKLDSISIGLIGGDLTKSKEFKSALDILEVGLLES